MEVTTAGDLIKFTEKSLKSAIIVIVYVSILANNVVFLKRLRSVNLKGIDIILYQLNGLFLF